MSQLVRSSAPHLARYLLGTLFFVFGLNGFLGFLPTPPLNEASASFMGALAATGYMFPLIKGTEVVAGAMLLGGRFVPLALTLLAPVVVNIALFHIALVPGLPMVALLLALQTYLAYAYRDAFRGVLDPQAKPAVAFGVASAHA